MYWRDLFPFFSRKEIVQLQCASRFLDNAIEKVKPVSLHKIDNLFIEMNSNKSATQLFTFQMTENGPNWHRIFIKNFRPPSYVRFSDVSVLTLIISGSFLKRLEKYRDAFANCNLCLSPTAFRRHSANETVQFLTEKVFTECKTVIIRGFKWNSASQMRLCCFPGVSNCNMAVISNEQTQLTGNEPIFESIIEWLHTRPANEKRVMDLSSFVGCAQLIQNLVLVRTGVLINGSSLVINNHKAQLSNRSLDLTSFVRCAQLIQNLVLRFVEDAEPHFYVIYMSNPPLDFLAAFQHFHVRKASTNEELMSMVLDNEFEEGVVFCLARMPPANVSRE